MRINIRETKQRKLNIITQNLKISKYIYLNMG